MALRHAERWESTAQRCTEVRTEPGSRELRACHAEPDTLRVVVRTVRRGVAADGGVRGASDCMRDDSSGDSREPVGGAIGGYATHPRS